MIEPGIEPDTQRLVEFRDCLGFSTGYSFSCPTILRRISEWTAIATAALTQSLQFPTIFPSSATADSCVGSPVEYKGDYRLDYPLSRLMRLQTSQQIGLVPVAFNPVTVGA